MKKKGFTLIELLAVIVILAIIAFIIIPIINNMIESSRKKVAEASARGYLDSVEKYVLLNGVNPTKYQYNLKGKTLNVNKMTELIEPLNDFIDVSGEKPVGTDDYVKVNSKGKVETDSGNAAELTINGYKVVCESSSNCSATIKINRNSTQSGNGTLYITKNGKYDVKNYSEVDVNVEGTNSESKIINDFSIKNGKFARLTTSISIDGEITTTDSSNIIGYIILVNGENKAITSTMPYDLELEANKKYIVKVVAIDKNAHFKESSNTLNITTPSIVTEVLDYPILTKTGMKNVKYVDLTNENNVTYDLDLSVDCTAADALDKKAYDGDESTYVDTSSGKIKFKIQSGVDIYYVAYKTNVTSGVWIRGVTNPNSGYIDVNNDSKPYNGYYHCTYYGKGSGAWQPGFVQTYIRLYELKYDTTIP